MKIVELKIEKLTCDGCNCGHCWQLVLFLLKSLFGIMTVKEDFDKNTVVIENENDVITVKEIVNILKKRGYNALL